jgi:hypothetical protein
MTPIRILFTKQASPLWEYVVLAAAAAVALLSAQRYAGSANDGSRLATVEGLVDRHTLVIDHSIFVEVPPCQDPAAPAPYPSTQPSLWQYGTRDKIFVNGHYYSHKSPVPALLMAGLYQAWQWTTGLTARQRPDLFCYTMTLGSSGLAYCIAVWGFFRLGSRLRLSLGLCLYLTASLALTSMALPYAQYVNDHILLLAVAVLILINQTPLADEMRTGGAPWWRPTVLGTLGGLGYTIDLGAGPVLLACSVAVVLYHCWVARPESSKGVDNTIGHALRRLRACHPTLVFVLAASPWLMLHHAVNYAIGGTFQPASAVPEYFQWPGSPFNEENMTGVWHHQRVGDFLTYAVGLLVGKRGFLAHNVALFLALPGLVVLWRPRLAEWPEVFFAVCFSGGTWLLYALGSNNYSGYCCSIRWLVPLLAPGYYVLAIFLREQPRYRGDFLILSGWGAVAGALMWWQGPWLEHRVSWFWVVPLLALVCWLLYGGIKSAITQ